MVHGVAGSGQSRQGPARTRHALALGQLAVRPVVGVARRVEPSLLRAAHGARRPVRAAAEDRGAGRGGKRPGAGRVVAVGVGDEDRVDRFAVEGGEQGRPVLRMVRAGIDHRDAAVPDDVGAGAALGEGPGIRADQPPDQRRHRLDPAARRRLAQEGGRRLGRLGLAHRTVSRGIDDESGLAGTLPPVEGAIPVRCRRPAPRVSRPSTPSTTGLRRTGPNSRKRPRLRGRTTNDSRARATWRTTMREGAGRRPRRRSVSSRAPVNRKRREGVLPPEDGPCLRPATGADGPAQRNGVGTTIRMGAALASLTTSAKPGLPEA